MIWFLKQRNTCYTYESRYKEIVFVRLTYWLIRNQQKTKNGSFTHTHIYIYIYINDDCHLSMWNVISQLWLVIIL